MQINTVTFHTENGNVEGVQNKWQGFNVLMITGPKGFIACPAIDIQACNSFGVAACLVESGPDNPIGTLEKMADRKITKINRKAKELGIEGGMIAKEAFKLIA